MANRMAYGGMAPGMVPGGMVPGAMPPPLPTQFHVAADGQSSGPYMVPQLAQMVVDGKFTRASLVWAPHLTQWTPAGAVAELSALFATGAAVPPPPPLP